MTVSGAAARAPGRTVIRRYLPVVVIVVVQLLLMTQTPSPSQETELLGNGSGSATTLPAAGSPVAEVAEASEQQIEGSATAGIAGAVAGAPASGAPRASVSAGTPSTTSNPGARAQSSARSQQLDALGRPLTGDKSKCAPNGVLQETVSFTSPPCMPRFEGDNGGATYAGVTADTITVVLIVPSYGQADRALVAAGLAETPERAQEDADTYATFFNKHYEFYGRKLKLITHSYVTGDGPSQRAEAKAIVAKYKPFAVGWSHIGGTPEPIADQFAQLGVLMLGAPSLSDAWFKQHAPYVWDSNPQGERVADMLGDYYCKKMHGKNASLAGDPTMRLKKRKLGILSSENPASLLVAQRLRDQVSGGMCGSSADGTTVYTYSTDASVAQNQAATLVTRKKNDGITTQVSPAGGVVGSQEDDRQQFQPENILSGVASSDLDTVGRLYQALTSPQQMQNTFGIGWQGMAHPIPDHEYYRAARDVNPRAEPAYISWGMYIATNLLTHLVQNAGPILTPQNVERGIRSSVQIGGYTNPKPWAGWKCCDPRVPMWSVQKPNSYTLWGDAREVYWSSSAISPEDNQPGSWQCVDGCKRYEVGQWPKGEPKQPA